METIGESQIWTFKNGENFTSSASCTQIRQSEACLVSDFLDLSRRVAELQYKNSNYVLLFRGQSSEYRNQKQSTSIKPSIFRSINGSNPTEQELIKRFDKLSRAEFELSSHYNHNKLNNRMKVSRHKVLRWSLLQHYEVCATPLLDVTHSLRIAASFATKIEKNKGYIFVIGVPNISGAITANAESGVQIVRLASVCPPEAVRPHIQEGYLLGEYPEMQNYDQKRHYQAYEVDFGRRLIAKFEFNPESFWNNKEFPLIGQTALYPDENDPFFVLAQDVKRRLEQGN